MSLPSSELIFLACAALGATVGAGFDIRERRIPNWLTASAAIFGLALHLALGGWAAMGFAALAGITGGAIFFLFFVVGGMGAGDVKLMAAVATISGFGHLGQLFVATTLFGAALAIVLAAVKGRLRATAVNVGRLILHHAQAGMAPHPELNLASATALRLPYALAIAGGCWAVLAAWAAR